MPRLCKFYPGICLTNEEKARKTLNQGKKNLSQGKKTSVRVQYTYYQNTHALQNLHTHTHTHSPTLTHTHAPTHTHTHTPPPTHTHTHTHTHTPHTPTHTPTHPHTHTPTHTHTEQKDKIFDQMLNYLYQQFLIIMQNASLYEYR